MKKRSKILVALLIGAAISLGINATNAEQVVIDGISNVDYNGATFGFTVFDPGVIQENTEFKNNMNAAYGSGFTNVSDVIIKDNTIFEANKSNAGGGAIMNYETLNIGKASFTDNSTQGHGGAIYNVLNSSSTISGAKFNKNSAAAYGGAIFTQGTLTVKDSEFTENHAATASGALHHSVGTLTLDNVLFKDNWSDNSAGALFSELQKNDMYTVRAIISNCIFDHNIAGNIGAVGNTTRAGSEGLGGMFIADTIFRYNESTADTTIPTSITGGAMGLGSESITRLERVTFLENTSNMDGGAIATRKHEAGNNKDAKLDIIDSKFVGNSAKRYGGAIDNYLFGSKNKEGAVYIVNTIFDDNKALSGGAIYNHENNSAISINSSGLINNKAGERGGAIYNQGSLEIINSDISSNEAIMYGGGIINANTNAFLKISNSTLNNNSTSAQKGLGGAIANLSGKMIVTDSVFTSNFNSGAQSNGGAIYNQSKTDVLEILNCEFNNNSTKLEGGAIYSTRAIKIDNTIFSENNTKMVDGYGGAISIRNSTDVESIINNSTFKDNSCPIVSDTTSMGGAIFARGKVRIDGDKFINNSAAQGGAIRTALNNAALTITNSEFDRNSSTAGGAIANFATMNISNSSFTKNRIVETEYEDGGGAIFLGSESINSIKDTIFDSNYSYTAGGAIATRHYSIGNNKAAKLDIIDSAFINNTAESNGGALYNTFYNSIEKPDVVTIKNTIFTGNKSGADGGAIYNDIEDRGNNPAVVSLTDTDFTNNTAGGKGGAIFANADLSIAAVTKNVVFSGNKASDGADIFMNTSGSTLTFNTGDDKMISIKDGISGSADKYNIAVNGDGTLEIASYVKNADITVNDFANLWLNEGSIVNGNNNSITLNDGTGLITINNKIDTFDKDLFTLNGEVDLAIDVDLANAKTDFFGGAISKDGDGILILDGVNIISDRVPTDKITIDLYKATGLNPSQLSINTEDFYAPTILTPIRYLQGSVNENGILSYAPTGNGFKDFNPAVMASPVAAQIGGYLTQLNSYDEAFRNMDMYMLMSKEARMVMKSRNKVAIAGENNVKFDSTSTPYENTAGWVRPYSTFEKVDLRGARKVSNVAYGSFFGGESELVDLGKGWDGMFGVYAGYNGSHQAYSGISTYQNGGTLGVVSMAYKGDFFTGLTLNAGANVGEASTFYGSDNFSMVMAGIASKSGYNIELAEGKLIIQPNFLMSYSFVNTFDYTNSAGVRMDSDPLHAIQIEPGIKLIGNLKNGWQPYGSVSMVWNIMDKTEFTANNISLPELSVKPYVKYGIGVRKTWGERLTGFFQTYFTNGGRTGVGLQAGFRFTFGQGGTEPSKSVEAPKPQKTVIKLGSSK